MTPSTPIGWTLLQRIPALYTGRARVRELLGFEELRASSGTSSEAVAYFRAAGELEREADRLRANP